MQIEMDVPVIRDLGFGSVGVSNAPPQIYDSVILVKENETSVGPEGNDGQKGYQLVSGHA